MRRLRVLGRMLVLTARASPRGTVLVAVLVIANAVGAAALAVSQRWLIDAVAQHAPTAAVLSAAIVAAAGFTAMNTGQRVGHNLREDLTGRVDVAITEEVLRMTGEIPTVTHLERPDYLDRLSVLRQGIRSLANSSWTVAGVLASIVSLGLSLWLLATVNPWLVILGILGVPPLLFARRGSRAVQRARDSSAELARHEERLHDICVDAAAAKEIWIAGSGPELSARADDEWQQVRRRETRANLAASAWQLAGWACYAAGVVAALALVAAQTARGEASVGDVILVITLSAGLRWQISATVSGTVETGRASHVVDHYLWLTEYARAARDVGTVQPPTRLTEGIRLENVDFHYPDHEDAVLRDVTLELPAGSVVGLVGANGAGKTTLVKLLTGMHRPSRGRITVDGTDLAELDPGRWSASHSGTFQDFVKFPTRVRETIGLGHLPAIDDMTAVRTAAERAGALSFIEGMAETQLGIEFDGVELSQGQWQKLAVARGLMYPTPLLLVLDEPTAALDPQAEHDLFESFGRNAADAGRRNGTITLLVSHRFSTVSIADTIVVLDGGRVTETGSHTELMARDGMYARLYRIQADGYTT